MSNLLADFFGFLLVVLSVLYEVKVFFLLGKDYDILLVLGNVWEHLEVAIDLKLFHVLQHPLEFHLPVVFKTANPSQMRDKKVWAFNNEKLRPEMFYEWI